MDSTGGGEAERADIVIVRNMAPTTYIADNGTPDTNYNTSRTAERLRNSGTACRDVRGVESAPLICLLPEVRSDSLECESDSHVNPSGVVACYHNRHLGRSPLFELKPWDVHASVPEESHGEKLETIATYVGSERGPTSEVALNTDTSLRGVNA